MPTPTRFATSTRTLELIGDFDAVERYDLTLLLGDVYKFAGNRKQARNHYSTILEELADSQVVARTVYQGRLCLAMSRLTLQEEPKSAVKWAVRGISAIDTSTERELHAELLIALSEAQMFCADYAASAASIDHAFAVIPDGATTARIQATLMRSGNSFWTSKLDNSLRYSQNALSLAKSCRRYLPNAQGIALIWPPSITYAAIGGVQYRTMKMQSERQWNLAI